MSLQNAKERLEEARGKKWSDPELAEAAVALAAELLGVARRRMSVAERRQAGKMARLVEDPDGKRFSMLLADRLFRSAVPRRSAEQMRHVLRTCGMPRFLRLWEKGALWFAKVGSLLAPEIVMPCVTGRMKAESAAVILSGEREAMRRFELKSRAMGKRLNLNLLGEAVLGEEEAARRLDAVVGRLLREDVFSVSVKISGIYSQINLVDYPGTLEEIKRRLRVLFRTAMKSQYAIPGGEAVRKIVYLDMEEYRDLHLTVDAFKQVLDESEFIDMQAGIVLQAYLPDSHSVQKQLTDWARRRMDRGGRAIRLRIVKGANLAMEKIDAEMHGWPQAPYRTKVESDANFKRMVAYGCEKANAEVVRLGVASHNLFDIAYTLLLRESRDVCQWVEFEMLEGMANHQARAVSECVGGLLMYAPVVDDRHFDNALAYLVRRLDENTAEENFLRALFSMKPGSLSWNEHRERFLASCEAMEGLKTWQRRKQNRAAEIPAVEEGPFANEPDTDWSLAPNRMWIERVMETWRDSAPGPVFPVIDGETGKGSATEKSEDPSRPGKIAYSYGLATPKDVKRALECAVKAQGRWNALDVCERAGILKAVAAQMARERGETIACMALDAGKAITESDVEVSEAIDFANYYARAFDGVIANHRPEGRGVVVVTPPWNFPYAIPAGGVLAALMAGNSVILKPAPETVLTAFRLASQFWSAGVPREVLQFVPCADDEKCGKALVSDPRVDTVVLTGSYQTAKMFRDWRPDLRVLAETSGKNSIIVTAAADLEQAVRDIVSSAFSHSGQKCSACSLVIAEREVYESHDFRRQLRDTAQSVAVGSAWKPASRITPLIHPPEGPLKRALTKLEEGEEWLLEPLMIDGNPRLWSPGIKLGVKPGSWFHQTECFGPVLGIMRAKNLREAIALQNDTPFGLTGGIHSLDPREVARWREEVQVGNAYVNRGITGAIVRRQPFGGWKRSSMGPGSKAGGPSYVFDFCRWERVGFPEDRSAPTPETSLLLSRVKQCVRGEDEREDLQVTAWSFAHAWQKIFQRGHDPSGLAGERNVLRYRARTGMLYRFGKDADPMEVFRVALAARTTGIPLDLSLEPSLCEKVQRYLEGEEGLRLRSESEAELVTRFGALTVERSYDLIRVPGGAGDALLRSAHAADVAVADGAVLCSGPLELRHWVREQSVTVTVHRYGNVID